VTATWEHALADCEARLDAAAAALDQGGPVVAPFTAPEVEGPIPEYLAGRARACSERGDQLQARLQDELERIRAELRRLPRIPRAPREAHFDAQA
jgi:hypothetical protein